MKHYSIHYCSSIATQQPTMQGSESVSDYSADFLKQTVGQSPNKLAFVWTICRKFVFLHFTNYDNER